MSFYGEDGCCLTCPDAAPDCLCFDCLCRKCADYEYDPYEDRGYCTIPREWEDWPRWEDYEADAEHVRAEAAARYGDSQTRIRARFSNGTIDRSIYYATVADLPHKIRAKLSRDERARYSETHPSWRYVTLLLKGVTVADSRNVPSAPISSQTHLRFTQQQEGER